MKRDAKERQRELIYKLKIHQLTKSEEQLLKLSLPELETEYKRMQTDCHPHSDSGSIHWIHAKR
ncbi:Fur-regulated basic protein FbpA [Peribacillus sp. SI8-4]|uniref:Fur-regulated basic protein FbpA n=1 Tax=Peribacillus sp. SI8-4 TaxID=3048009 RepID=UPI0025572384|nr:Fur-regulated basic protein FbpA [Peribacillus sp. SI8-4]